MNLVCCQARVNLAMILWVFLLQVSPKETPQQTAEYEQNSETETLLTQEIFHLLLPTPYEPAYEAGCWLALTLLASPEMQGSWAQGYLLGHATVPKAIVLGCLAE